MNASNDTKPVLELPDEKTQIELLEQALRQSGVKFRRVRPGEKGGFFIEGEDGRLERYEPDFKDIFPDAPPGIQAIAGGRKHDD